jgi:hypothetical protein
VWLGGDFILHKAYVGWLVAEHGMATHQQAQVMRHPESMPSIPPAPPQQDSAVLFGQCSSLCW